MTTTYNLSIGKANPDGQVASLNVSTDDFDEIQRILQLAGMGAGLPVEAAKMAEKCPVCNQSPCACHAAEVCPECGHSECQCAVEQNEGWMDTKNNLQDLDGYQPSTDTVEIDVEMEGIAEADDWRGHDVAAERSWENERKKEVDAAIAAGARTFDDLAQKTSLQKQSSVTKNMMREYFMHKLDDMFGPRNWGAEGVAEEMVSENIPGMWHERSESVDGTGGGTPKMEAEVEEGWNDHVMGPGYAADAGVVDDLIRDIQQGRFGLDPNDPDELDQMIGQLEVILQDEFGMHRVAARLAVEAGLNRCCPGWVERLQQAEGNKPMESVSEEKVDEGYVEQFDYGQREYSADGRAEVGTIEDADGIISQLNSTGRANMPPRLTNKMGDNTFASRRDHPFESVEAMTAAYNAFLQEAADAETISEEELDGLFEGIEANTSQLLIEKKDNLTEAAGVYDTYADWKRRAEELGAVRFKKTAIRSQGTQKLITAYDRNGVAIGGYYYMTVAGSPQIQPTGHGTIYHDHMSPAARADWEKFKSTYQPDLFPEQLPAGEQHRRDLIMRGESVEPKKKN
jgi:hypothetical protein